MRLSGIDRRGASPLRFALLTFAAVEAGAIAPGDVEESELVHRVLSDDGGGYALPLRYEPNNTAVAIDAVDHRTNQNGQTHVTLPADLGSSKVIVIT